jgi:hypothetical protein
VGDLDGDRAIEPGVDRSKDFSHAARANGLFDLIGAKLRRRGIGHLNVVIMQRVKPPLWIEICRTVNQFGSGRSTEIRRCSRSSSIYPHRAPAPTRRRAQVASRKSRRGTQSAYATVRNGSGVDSMAPSVRWVARFTPSRKSNESFGNCKGRPSVCPGNG